MLVLCKYLFDVTVEKSSFILINILLNDNFYKVHFEKCIM